MSLFSQIGEDTNHLMSHGASLYNFSSPISELLERLDFTLEELLEEDELIQEVKTKNQKVLEFLATEEHVLQLVHYITVPAEETANELRKLKYPYMSCEVICCDIQRITDILCRPKCIAELFKLLDQDSPLDTRISGYFEKVLSLLLIRAPRDVTDFINQNASHFLKAFIRHCDSYSIAELIKRLLQPMGMEGADGMDLGMGMGMGMGLNMGGMHLSMGGLLMGEDSPETSTPGTPTGQHTLQWCNNADVIDLLVRQLHPLDENGGNIDSDVHKHVSEILVDIIHWSSRAQTDVLPSQSLSDFLERKETVELIIEAAMPTAQNLLSPSSMTSALTVLGTLISRHSNTHYSVTVADEELPSVISCTIKRMPQLVRSLKGEDFDPGMIRTQTHEDRPRLGLRRLKLVGLAMLLIQTKYHAVDAAIVENDVINVCLDLFFKFDLVNMLHLDVESMVISIVEAGSPSLQKALIDGARLFERILNAYDENNKLLSQGRVPSKGYMGHLRRISNSILTVTEESRESVEGRGSDLASLSETHGSERILDLFYDAPCWDKWCEFTSTTLVEINTLENSALGTPADGRMEQDPYGSSLADNLMNSQFAEMLESGQFGDDEDGDIAVHKTSTLRFDPNDYIHADDSSSDEEDFDFNPRGNSGTVLESLAVDMHEITLTTAFDTTSASVPTDAAAQAEWADFKATEGLTSQNDFADFANFETPSIDSSPSTEIAKDRS